VAGEKDGKENNKAGKSSTGKESAECRKEEAQQNDEHLRDCDCCSVDFLDDHNDDSILASEHYQSELINLIRF